MFEFWNIRYNTNVEIRRTRYASRSSEQNAGHKNKNISFIHVEMSSFRVAIVRVERLFPHTTIKSCISSKFWYLFLSNICLNSIEKIISDFLIYFCFKKINDSLYSLIFFFASNYFFCFIWIHFLCVEVVYFLCHLARALSILLWKHNKCFSLLLVQLKFLSSEFSLLITLTFYICILFGFWYIFFIFLILILICFLVLIFIIFFVLLFLIFILLFFTFSFLVYDVESIILIF